MGVFFVRPPVNRILRLPASAGYLGLLSLSGVHDKA